MSARDPLDWTISAVFAALVLLAGVWQVASGVGLTHEDGFYYFKIAQHVASGHGSTFDGQHLTNGYHPLWLLLLVPVFWLAPSAGAALTVGVLVQVALSAVAVILVYHTARLLMGRVGAVVAAQLWLVCSASVTLGGQEFAVHAVVVLAVAHLWLRARPDVTRVSLATYGALGLLLALSTLARLETIALAGMIGGWLVWPRDRRQHSRPWAAHLAAVGLPVLLVSVGYVAANLVLVGDPFPVSAAVKREWSGALLAADPWFQSYGWVGAKARHMLWPLSKSESLSTVHLALGIPVVGGLWSFHCIARRAVPDGALRRLMRGASPFLAFGLAQAAGYTLVYHGSLSYPPHYFVVQRWLAALLVGAVVEDRLSRLRPNAQNPRAVPLSVLALLLVPLAAAVEVRAWQVARQEDGIVAPLHDAADWVSRHVPAEAVVGSWNAGAIGFLSGRAVVNLDGLVNSWDYFRQGRRDLCQYWRESGVTYLVDIFEANQPVTPVRTPLNFGNCAHRLRLLLTDDRYRASWRIEAYFVDLEGAGP